MLEAAGPADPVAGDDGRRGREAEAAGLAAEHDVAGADRPDRLPGAAPRRPADPAPLVALGAPARDGELAVDGGAQHRAVLADRAVAGRDRRPGRRQRVAVVVAGAVVGGGSCRAPRRGCRSAARTRRHRQLHPRPRQRRAAVGLVADHGPLPRDVENGLVLSATVYREFAVAGGRAQRYQRGRISWPTGAAPGRPSGRSAPATSCSAARPAASASRPRRPSSPATGSAGPAASSTAASPGTRPPAPGRPAAASPSATSRTGRRAARWLPGRRGGVRGAGPGEPLPARPHPWHRRSARPAAPGDRRPLRAARRRGRRAGVPDRRRGAGPGRRHPDAVPAGPHQQLGRDGGVGGARRLAAAFVALGAEGRTARLPRRGSARRRRRAGRALPRLRLSAGPATGVHAVLGPLAVAYEQNGAEAGPLGFPVADQDAPADGQLRSTFERGAITLDVASGAVTVAVLP